MSKHFEEEKDVTVEERKVVRVNSEKKPKKERINIKQAIAKEFKSKKFKNGAYSSATIVVILIAVIFVNMIAGEFDLTVDLSTENMYTLTDQTETVLDGLTDDITLYYIVQEGSEIATIENIVKKYPSLSDKITIKYKDPDLYPSFINEYVESTTDVTGNSVIVVNEFKDRSKYIDFYDMVQYTTDYSSYYTTGSSSTSATSLDVEGQITAAIQYVSSENTSTIYQVTGHGETEVSDYMTNEFNKLCVDVESLETRTAESIPDDCAALLINGPTTDYTEDEVTLIEDFLKDGGKAIILTNSSGTGLTNFYSLLNYYGLEISDGIVFETSSYASASGYWYNFPDVGSSDITEGIDRSTNPVVVALSKGIRLTDTRDTVSVTDLLTSSDEAFCKMNMESSTYEQEASDVDGPFKQAVLVSETYNDVTTELVVLSSQYIMDDTFTAENSYGNAVLMNNIVSYMTGQETGLSIPTRSLSETYITTTSANVVFWSVILVLIIPAALLITGFVIWYVRRRA